MENYNYYTDEERKKLDEDIIAQNQALSDLIANQQKEEQQIKDNYDSFGSRLTRALEVFGAGMRGENIAPVIQNQRSRLDNQLKQAQDRYKSNRDASWQRSKDLLARKDAIAKFDYDRAKDKNAEERANKELGLKEKALNWQMTQGDIKQQQAEKAIQDAKDEKEQQRKDLLEDLSFINKGQYEDTNVLLDLTGKESDKAKLTEAKINRFNNNYVKFAYPEVSDKDRPSIVRQLVKDGILPNASESKNTTIAKLKGLNIGFSDKPIKSIKQPLEHKDGRRVVRSEIRPTGTPGGSVTIYYFDDGSYGTSLE